MKKHIVIPFVVGLLLVVMSGLYLRGRYAEQIEGRKKMLAMYISEVQTQLDVITARIKELPHIVLPMMHSVEIQEAEIRTKHAENIAMLEQFYVDNSSFIHGISVFNNNGDVFNLYRDANGEFIRDVYRSRSISTLYSKTGIIYENGSFSIVIPVFDSEEVIGNVAISLDLIPMQEELYRPYIERGVLWVSTLLDEETLITFPVDEPWELSHEAEILQLSMQRDSFYCMGRIAGVQVLTYMDLFSVPDFHLGIAFSSNVSPLKSSLIVTFIIICLLLALVAAASAWVLNRMITQYDDLLHRKDQEINLLQIMYDKSPVAYITSRNGLFFTANNYFFKLFEGLASMDDSRRVDLPFTLQQEFKEWNLCTWEKDGKELFFGRRQMTMDLDGNRYTIDAFWDVTEIEQRLKEAVRSRIAKSELLSRVSANVKKTMSYVGDTAILLRQQHPEDEHLAGICQLTANLSGMIDSVQDYNSIESGQVVFDEVPFHLVDEIKQVIELYYDEIQRRNIELQMHISPAATPNIVGDPQRFRQILNELLNNAIRYTSDGSIRISLETVPLQGRKVMIKCSVDDTGEGMPREKLKKLFSLDLRANDANDSIGLGIVIIRRLINLMGGTLRAASPSPISTNPAKPGMQFSFSIVCFSDQPFNKNLNFTSIVSSQQVNVLLIASNAHQVKYLVGFLHRKGIQADMFIYNRESSDLLINKLIIDKHRYHIVIIATENSEISFSIADETMRNDLTGNSIYILVDTQSQKGNYLRAKSLNMDYYLLKNQDVLAYESILTTHFPALLHTKLLSAAEPEPSATRILIADHNILSQAVARMIFKQLGYCVEFAQSTQELLDLLKNQTCDIVFIDLKLPPDDGFETVKILRTKNYKMPVIAMTSTLTKHNIRRITDSGIDGYLPKPLNPDSVRQILYKWNH